MKNTTRDPQLEFPFVKLCKCGCGEPVPLATRTSTKYGLIKGHPVNFVHGHSRRGTNYPKRPVEERFWEKVDKNGPIHPVLGTACWLWTGSISRTGYGSFRFNEKTHHVHRVSYELAYGPIPDGMSVLHHCDVRNCVSPYHLFAGTQVENIKDMDQKGRGNRARGEGSGKAKLTEKDVRVIRRLHAEGRTCVALGKSFGVTHQSIDAIVNRQSWRHVE